MNEDILPFQTERLLIREAVLDDSDFFLHLLNEPEYIKNIRDSGVRNRQQAKKFIQEFYLNSYSKYGYGLFVIELLETQQSVGVAGFVSRSEKDPPDLGFALLEEYRGQGYIAEACGALIKKAFDITGSKELLGITVPNNANSIKVLLKLGFKELGQRPDAKGSGKLNIYSMRLPIKKRKR